MQRYMAPQHQKAKSVRAQSAACTNTWGRPHDHAHTHAHGARAKRMRGRARIRPHATHVHEHAGARTGAYIHHITLASTQPQSAHMSTRPHARGHTPCRSSSATAPSRRLSAVRPSTRDRSSARSPDAPPRETPQLKQTSRNRYTATRTQTRHTQSSTPYATTPCVPQTQKQPRQPMHAPT